MAVLGTCANITPGYYVTVNEASTVAAAYALAGFATDATHIGSSGTALAKQGVVNAGTLALKLVDQGTGTANATFPNNATATVPVNTINALADILSYCVNSTGSGNCTNLFSKTLSASGAQPVDTATAAIYMAQNPAANGNVGALISLIPATGAPFATTLSSANDFTLGVTYSGGGFKNPISVAIDGSGDAWVADDGSNALIGIRPSGSYLTGSSGFTDPGLNSDTPGIAVDTNGNIWYPSLGSDTVAKISPSGTFTYYGTGAEDQYFSYPAGVAIDGSGDAWVANFLGNNITEILPNGSFGVNTPWHVSFTSPGTAGMLQPAYISIDGSGDIWTANDNGPSASEISNTGVALSGANGFNGNGIVDPLRTAIDSKGNIWIPSPATSLNSTTADGQAVVEISHAGSFLSGSSGYSIGAQSGPAGVAIDGSGNVWVTAFGAGYVAELSNTGTLLSGNAGNGYGYTAGGEFTAAVNSSTNNFLGTVGIFGIAVDGSGNVWVTGGNSGTNVVEMVGAAAPVITPICAGLPVTPTADGSSNLGTRP
jgi:hypothetical protein